MNEADAFSRLTEEVGRRIREITPHELSRKKQLPLIVDVREEDEFVRGHLAGAQHISRNLLEQQVGRIAPDLGTPIVVYCSSGQRGALAASTLLKMGYKNVHYLAGGVQNWLESGGLVETPHSFLKS
ncbi:MAG: hypothetical protein JO069_04595 [Verrucomicrobia bacterium]|nr:hypothetical protein [Verrucomicrobiota bacterium]